MATVFQQVHVSDIQGANLDREELVRSNFQQYPHMKPNDPLASMTENEIIHKQIRLDPTVLNSHEIQNVYQFLERNREVFSLHGELSSCPNFEADITLDDEKPFARINLRMTTRC